MKNDHDISVSRAVGRFFGHIWGATTKPVPDESNESKKRTQIIASEVQETQGEVENQKVILRRTTIDEVEIVEESVSVDHPKG